MMDDPIRNRYVVDSTILFQMFLASFCTHYLKYLSILVWGCGYGDVCVVVCVWVWWCVGVGMWCVCVVWVCGCGCGCVWVCVCVCVCGRWGGWTLAQVEVHFKYIQH